MKRAARRESQLSSGAGGFAKLALGALGVVYGDLGTSPLYTIRECLKGTHGVEATPVNVLGICSLVFWALMLVVVIKYITFVLNADYEGEGGAFALIARVMPQRNANALVRLPALVALGLCGACLLYGESIITPAISVLSAVEGLRVATSAFEHLVVPLTVLILAGLFLVQKRGTGRLGAVLGPVMATWFLAIGIVGARWILRHPAVLVAVHPGYALAFLAHHGGYSLFVLGAVTLCITGGEALFADLGHFGKQPIRVAWFGLVYPALLLNYFGQGAFILEVGGKTTNPFYEMVPGVMLYPMVLLATCATVIASQAMISGAFSLSHQAVQLGFLPRMKIVHTSGTTVGQIYVPAINGFLGVACIALVVGFRSSSSLAAAYGIAVTGAMTITSILFFAVARQRWGMLRAGTLTILFLSFDLAFFVSNVVKIPNGGWIPLAVGAFVFVAMTTWKRGRSALGVLIRQTTLALDQFIESVKIEKPVRVPGIAVFMTLNPSVTPLALLHNVKHNKVLHETVILLSLMTERVPEVAVDKAIEVKPLGEGFYSVVARHGFMQTPRVPEVLERIQGQGIPLDAANTSFYLGRESLLVTGRSGMSRWRAGLFSMMSKNASAPTAYFGIPANRVVELGALLEI
jgi:KUP system potassium uptake protein